MIKLIPNDALSLQLYILAEAIDSKAGFSKEYILYNNIFFILGDPFSLGFDLINKKAGKCKPRSEMKMDFKNAYFLEPKGIPSALINMIGNVFNQWFGIMPFDSQGVFMSLNIEGNKQLKPYDIAMIASEDSLKVTYKGKEITYEEAINHCIKQDAVINLNYMTEKIAEQNNNLKTNSIRDFFSNCKNDFMKGYYEGCNGMKNRLNKKSNHNLGSDKEWKY